MTWNYRVIRRVVNNTGEPEVMYAIHEVYYLKGKPHTVTVRPAYPSGETFEELRRDMDHYARAISQPVLEYDEIGIEFVPEAF